MNNDLNSLYTELGVNIELHNQLTAHGAESHRKHFLWQKNRPDSIKAFDHALHASHAGRVKEIYDYRKQGGKSIGTFCIYIPDEIALAADVLPIPLCGGSGWSVNYADKMFPRDICPLIRSTFGMALSGTCPYGKLKDWAIGETTCDAKKKAWDLLGMRVMELPQKKNPLDRDLWHHEVNVFKGMVEELSGVKVTPERLAASIQLVNRKRAVLQKIGTLRMLDHPPISGLDALLVSQVALNMDITDFVTKGEILIRELEQRAAAGVCAYEKPGPRVIFAGTPAPMGFAKVHFAAESSGLRIVADESCTGIRYYRDLIDETPASLDEMIKRVANRYFAIDCPCFSPNTERVDNINAITSEYKAQGVVHSILMYCHGFNIEAGVIDRALERKQLPSLKIVTDYSDEDTAQLCVRMESFAEMLVG